MFFNSKTKKTKVTNEGDKDGKAELKKDPAMRHCTTEDRLDRIHEAVVLLHSHLSMDRPGICLPADFRWAVAMEARACTTCPGCAALKMGKACNLAGTGQGEHSIMKKVDHSTSPTIPFSITDRASWQKILKLVHFIIYHPNRANPKWYDETIKSLGHTSILDKEAKKNMPEDQQKRLMETLFVEISAVALASHAIFVTYTTMGRPVPALPELTEEDIAKQARPSFQDIVTAGMLKEGRSFRAADPKCCDTPYCVIKDVNQKSQAFLDLSPDVQKFCLASMKVPHPLCMLSLSPESMWLASEMSSKILFSETVGAAPWKKLDPAEFCVTGPPPSQVECFTRLDSEIISLAVAEDYGATFCERFHSALIMGLQAGNLEKSEREVLLILLTKTAIALPRDTEALQQVLNRVKDDYGDETLIESAASMGYGQIVGRAARLADVKPLPSGVYYMLPKIIKVLKRFSS